MYFLLFRKKSYLEEKKEKKKTERPQSDTW